MADLEQLDQALNDLSISSNKKAATAKDDATYNIECIRSDMQVLSLSSETKTEPENSLGKCDEHGDTLAKIDITSSSSNELEKNRTKTREPDSVDPGKVDSDTVPSTQIDDRKKQNDTQNDQVKMNEDRPTGQRPKKACQHEDQGDEENVLSMELGARGPSHGVAVPRKAPQQSSRVDVGTSNFCARGPLHGVAVPRKGSQQSSRIDVGTSDFHGDIPTDFNFGRHFEAAEENDPPFKFRRPQEHEELMPSPTYPGDVNPEKVAFPRHLLQDANPDLPDISPSISKYDSDEYKRLADDLLRGAEHNEVMIEETEEMLKEVEKQLIDSFNHCGEVPHQELADNVLLQQPTQMDGLSHILPSLSGKFDSGDMKFMMQDLDNILMEPDEDTKVISVTDLIEGSSNINEMPDKMSPMTDFPGSSPGSVSTNSPYSDQPTPGSDGVSSPGEGDESSRDSFASSKRSSGSPGQRKMTTDQLPKPDISSLLTDSTAKSDKNQGSTPQEKPKKSSKTKAKTGRPRGRPRKIKDPQNKPATRQLASIAPKPLIPQLTSGTTTLIILQNPGTVSNLNTGIPQPGIMANAPLAVKQTVVSGGQSVVSHLPTSVAQSAQSGTHVGGNSSAKPAAAKKTGALRPESLMTDMLPSEKDKKNLKKAERIVEEIPEAKFTNVDIYGDTLLHILSLAKGYDELIEHLFSNSQSLFTTGIPQERFMYKALVERMNSQGILTNLINMRNKQNQTPLYLAVTTTKTELVRLLLEKGADPNICAHTSVPGFRMPLHVAASKGKSHLDVLKLLLECPQTEINATNSERKTALHCAVEAHNPPLVDSSQTTELLLKHKANIQKGPNEQTPLHMVIEKKDYNFLCFTVNLLAANERKAILNIKDSLGNTCLHRCAVLTKQKDASGKYLTSVLNMMRFLLLVCEVDIGIVNQKNETAKKLVCKENDQVMTVYREAENRRRNKRSQEKMRDMEALRLHQLRTQMATQSNINPAMQNMGLYNGWPAAGQLPQMGAKRSLGQNIQPGPYASQSMIPGQSGRPTQPNTFDTNRNCRLTHSPPGPQQHIHNSPYQQTPMVNPQEMVGIGPQGGSERGIPSQMMSQGNGFIPAAQYKEADQNKPCSRDSQLLPSQMPGYLPGYPQSNSNNSFQQGPFQGTGSAMLRNTTNNLPTQCGNNDYGLPIPELPERLSHNNYSMARPASQAPVDSDIKDCTFEDLERLVSLGGNDNVSSFANGIFAENTNKMANELGNMSWNVPFTGTEMPYDKATSDGNNVYTNTTSQSCQRLTHGPAKLTEDLVETTKNSFLEQLVNGGCSLSDRPTDHTDNIGYDGVTTTSTACTIQSVSNSHSDMVRTGPAQSSAMTKAESNNITNLMGINQPLPMHQSISTFQGSGIAQSHAGKISMMGRESSDATVPLHHIDFGLQQFDTSSRTKARSSFSPPSGMMGTTPYTIDQNWVQSTLQTVQNM